MGTNFYLMSKSKNLMRTYFAVDGNCGPINEEYTSVDEPYLGYQVHLNKLSAGWRPLFQKHKTIKTFKELEYFCLENDSIIGIYDEYGKKYTWKQYFDKVTSHNQYPVRPCKWVYEKDPFFKDRGPTVHIVSCTEQEAEIYTPFCHRLYAEKERQARSRFNVYEKIWGEIKYWEDPDYPFDWMEGEFC